MTNPYLDRRDFRAVMFRDDQLDGIPQVAELFEGHLRGEMRNLSNGVSNKATVRGATVTYLSSNCFLRTTDPSKRDFLRATKRSNQFQYETYVLSYEKGSARVFLVAIPFSAMARELFGKIHEHKPSAEFVYLKPALDNLIASLIEQFKGSDRIKTVGINWTVTGDTGRSDQVVLRGSDVIHSAMFQHLTHTSQKLSIVPRKIQVRFSPPGASEPLKLAFDKFGNYSVWVRPEGHNLPTVFHFYELLDRADLIRKEQAFPVRNRDEDPIIP